MHRKSFLRSTCIKYERRYMKLKKILSFLTLSAILITGGKLMSEAKTGNWDKTFPKSDKVNIEKVHFKNRFGIELTGDLYTPKEIKGKLPAIAVSGPFAQ